MPARLLLEIGNSTVKLATVDHNGNIAVERYSNLEALLRRIEASDLPILAAVTGRAPGGDILERLGDAELVLEEADPPRKHRHHQRAAERGQTKRSFGYRERLTE